MTRDLAPALVPILLVLAVGALAPAAPAAADWLVTGDGTAIETDGPWSVQGGQVLFTLKGGGLVALPASDIDLEASAARNAPPPPPEAPPPAAGSRWTITDADVARAPQADAAAVGEPGEAPEQRSAVPGLEVASWSEDDVRELGVSLRGTLANRGPHYATSVRVQVALYDEGGVQIARRAAVPTRTALRPGESADFAVAFPDVTAFATARFEIEGQGFAGTRPAEEPAPGAEPGEEAGTGDADEALEPPEEEELLDESGEPDLGEGDEA